MSTLGITRLRNLKYIVFDIETTGLSIAKNLIIQIAAVKVDGGRVPSKLIDEVKKVNPKKSIRNNENIFNGFINPGIKIPKNITDLTGIDDSLVMAEPFEKVIIDEFFKFSGDRILVAHNGLKFDVPFIEAASRRNRLPYENFLCFDTLWLSRKLFPEESKHSLTALIDRFQLKKRYPKSFAEQQHNALVDVMFTAEMLNIFITNLELQDKDKLLII
jgi:DNA polymerase III subunit alpha, Gram-positive type